MIGMMLYPSRLQNLVYFGRALRSRVASMCCHSVGLISHDGNGTGTYALSITLLHHFDPSDLMLRLEASHIQSSSLPSDRVEWLASDKAESNSSIGE